MQLTTIVAFDVVHRARISRHRPQFPATSTRWLDARLFFARNPSHICGLPGHAQFCNVCLQHDTIPLHRPSASRRISVRSFECFSLGPAKRLLFERSFDRGHQAAPTARSWISTDNSATTKFHLFDHCEVTRTNRPTAYREMISPVPMPQIRCA